MCVRESTFEDAAGLCQELGSRLCTAAELERGEGVPEACGFDSVFVWSWVSGGAAQCPGNSSLGVAGRPGEWFSFRPTVANAFLEVRLLAEGQAEGEISSSIAPDIFDGHGDRVPTLVAPTLYSRRDGSMLRWNTSTAGTGPFFVRVVVTARHSVVVASPQPYEVVLKEVRSSDWSTAAPLSASHGAAVAVRLPFAFKFFGVEQQHIWVSKSGYISFEEQRRGTFADVGSIHSAVVACGGHFELARDGAAVTMMQSATELQVRWRGALFNSSELSDVVLSLNRDGSVSIGWAAVHLSSGGSSENGLVAWLSLNATVVGNGSETFETVLLGADASAHTISIDATRYFATSATLRPYSVNTSADQQPAFTVEDTAWTYVGCFRDNEGGRDMIGAGPDYRWLRTSSVVHFIDDVDGSASACESGRPVIPDRATNIVTGKPTAQSSSAYGSTDGRRAVDGNTDGNFQGNGNTALGSCTHTLSGVDPEWWQVDLGDTYAVWDFQLYHRTDCCQDRLVGANIIVSRSTNYNTGITCHTSIGGIADRLEVGSCNGAVGNFITVSQQSNHPHGDNAVAICEFIAQGVTSNYDVPRPEIHCNADTCVGSRRRSNSTSSGFFVAITDEAGRTFSQARAFCKAHGFTDLASVHSSDEMRMAEGVCEHLGNTINWSIPCFIGLSTSVSSRWEWSDGTPTDWEMLDQLEGFGSWVGIGRQEPGGSSAWRFQDTSAPTAAFICEDRARSALQLVGDARVVLPPMMLGGPTVAVSAWVRLGYRYGSERLALFSSYQSARCGESVQCKNAVGATLDSHGWLAIGTETGSDLVVPGAIFDSTLVEDFFLAAQHRWAHFTFSIVERTMHVFVNGVAVGVGMLEADLPHMLRSENSIGGSLNADPVGRFSRLTVADFRVYDRSLSSMEAAALHTNPSSECCVSAGLISAFGIGSIDLSPEIMAAMTQPSAVSVRSEAGASNGTAEDTTLQPCRLSEASAIVRDVDICGDVATIEDCHGVISDGAGPYIRYRRHRAVRSLGFGFLSSGQRPDWPVRLPWCQVRRLWPPAAGLPRWGVRADFRRV